MPEPGTLLAGRYRIVRRLGSGGMAVVYAAEDSKLERTVAVKLLHTPSDDAGKRFRREARLGAGLRHPGLVTVFDVLEDGATVVLVTELVDGPSLAERLREGRMEPNAAVALLAPVAAALDHAHAKGIVHRDVKPGNILIGADGRPKLADLGIATAAEATRITAHGSVLGTPAYMAPEQLEGAEPSPAADLYAFAAVAFEMLAGRPARVGRTAMELVHLARTEPPPDLRDSWPEAPAGAAGALARGLARDPAQRPATATELVEALTVAITPAAPPVVAALRPRAALPGPPPRRRAPALPLALLAVPAALVVILVLVITSGGGAEKPRPTAAARRSPTATPAATAATAATAVAGADPVSAVRGFYEQLAAHDFDAAWALAGPKMRAAFGSRASFERQLTSLRSIQFGRVEEQSRRGGEATVALETTARHTDRVDHCTGTLRAVRSGGRWQVEPLGLSCERDPG